MSIPCCETYFPPDGDRILGHGSRKEVEQHHIDSDILSMKKYLKCLKSTLLSECHEFSGGFLHGEVPSRVNCHVI
jgi:hypothetical protein